MGYRSLYVNIEHHKDDAIEYVLGMFCRVPYVGQVGPNILTMCDFTVALYWVSKQQTYQDHGVGYCTYNEEFLDSHSFRYTTI